MATRRFNRGAVRAWSHYWMQKGAKLRHTLRMGTKFLKSNPRIMHSQKGGRGNWIFLQPR